MRASTKKLFTTTISDQLRMSTNFRSKAISSALTAYHLETGQYNSGLKKLVQNGYHQKNLKMF